MIEEGYDMNGSASRVLFVFLIAVLLLTSVPSSLAIAQTSATSESAICEPDTAEAPSVNEDYVQRVREDSTNATPVFMGEEFTAFAGIEEFETAITVDSFEQREIVPPFRADQGKSYLVFCMTATPIGGSDKVLPLSLFFLREIGAPEGPTARIDDGATQYANESILGTEIAPPRQGYDSYGTSWVRVPADQETQIALVFEVPENFQNFYLKETDRYSVMVGVIQGTVSGAPASASNQTTEANTEAEQSFGEDILVTVLPNKWKLNFDPNVEVRYFIGDQSITPRRGQFLVIWFDQSTPDNEPLPMGAFALRASTGPGEPFQTYDISRLGTAALIVTEYDWLPDFMDDGVEYRTGVVFDIRPEDTHFELRFEVPGSPTGNELPVSITFDA
jgi:hypothetical protein